jgi:hypothetical protein
MAMKLTDPSQIKGPEAAALRQKKFAALRSMRVPEDGLPGSLALTHRRCGKPGCRCADPSQPAHPQWLLTFMVDGRKHVESVPADWGEDVQRRLAAGRAAREALDDVLTANAQLLGLERRARVRKRKKRG